jgi:hypothetical protein
MSMRLSPKVRAEYEKLLKKEGQDRFYRHVLGAGLISRTDMCHPEILMLDLAEAFFTLHQQTGQDNHFIIGKLLRRAAHRLYVEFGKSVKNYPSNERFIRLVK